MKKYFVSYYLTFLLPILFFGCSITSSERLKDTDRRVVEISKTTQTLEKRLDDLSRSISLIVNDGNGLHNDMDDIKNRNNDIQKKIKEIETVIKNLDEHVCGLKANYKTTEEDLNKRIDDIQKAEIELSNRLETMKLGIKEEVKENTVSPTTP
jgi:peptidoglycan hydrolase CwlO-like protein